MKNIAIILGVIIIYFGCTSKTIINNYGDQAQKIVVLGSSTAFGTGPEIIDSAWVYLLTKYEKKLNYKNEVTNLAKGGYTTYHILPDNTNIVANRPKPDFERNISRALKYNPDIIIVNLPSNDAAYNYSVKEQMVNFSTIDSICTNKSIDLYVTTAQPRNFNKAKRDDLIKLNLALYEKFTDRVIDFWTDIANNNGTIKEIFNSGDGVHLNSHGHRILFRRVKDKIEK